MLFILQLPSHTPVKIECSDVSFETGCREIINFPQYYDTKSDLLC